MSLFNVFHQYTPTKVVGRETDKSGDEVRIYEPAVFFRGAVEADTILEALRKAYSISSRPMVIYGE